MCGYILAIVLAGVYFTRQRLKEEEQRIDKLLEDLIDEESVDRSKRSSGEKRLP